MIARTFVILWICGIVAMAAGEARATVPGEITFVVTKLVEGAEDVDANPGDGICATADGECTLRAAVQEANALPGPQTIFLPPGEYPLLRGGYGENAADRGDLDILDDLSVTGAGRNDTAISGKYEVAERIFDVRAPAAVTIRDLTVRDVFMSSFLPPDTEYCGGGIRNAGNLALMRADIVDNVFRGAGAAICNQGSLEVTDSTLKHNQAGFNGGGGGLFNEGTALLKRVIISDNIADTWGGAAYTTTGTLLTRA